MKPDFGMILKEAHEAAQAAVEKMGPENQNLMDCGFAWVSISGNSPLAYFCRASAKRGGNPEIVGRKMETGWTWWKPGGFRGQAIGHHEAGAKAFRAVLAKHGIRADFGSRYD